MEGSDPPRHTWCSSIPRPVLRPVGLYLPGLHNIHSSKNWVTSTKQLQRLREECSRCKVTQPKDAYWQQRRLEAVERSTQVNRCFNACFYLRYIQHLNFFYGLCTESGAFLTYSPCMMEVSTFSRFKHLATFKRPKPGSRLQMFPAALASVCYNVDVPIIALYCGKLVLP